MASISRLGLLRWGLFVALLPAVWACGPSTPQSRHAMLPLEREATRETPQADQPEHSERQLELPEVSLGEEFEIRGFSGVLLRESDLVLALKRVRWSEMMLGERALRRGYAELQVTTVESGEQARIRIGQWRQFGDYAIGVLDAGDYIDERSSRKFPWARLSIRRR